MSKEKAQIASQLHRIGDLLQQKGGKTNNWLVAYFQNADGRFDVVVLEAQGRGRAKVMEWSSRRTWEEVVEICQEKVGETPLRPPE